MGSITYPCSDLSQSMLVKGALGNKPWSTSPYHVTLWQWVYEWVEYQQGKSEGFDSCDRPSNLTQIGFKSSIYQKISWWYDDGNIIVKKVWRTDGQTDWTILRAAWSQLKIIIMSPIRSAPHNRSTHSWKVCNLSWNSRAPGSVLVSSATNRYNAVSLLA